MSKGGSKTGRWTKFVDALNDARLAQDRYRLLVAQLEAGAKVPDLEMYAAYREVLTAHSRFIATGRPRLHFREQERAEVRLAAATPPEAA